MTKLTASYFKSHLQTYKIIDIKLQIYAIKNFQRLFINTIKIQSKYINNKQTPNINDKNTL